ncbi:hypothetical protein LTR08_007806 [Meristemomyces frigidus]|nr:hypothetical protein LTR08_007806 [Meristemomyces frigidus]
MAPSSQAQFKAIFGAGNLHTPEEPVRHDFSANDMAGTGTKLAPIQFMSPPISPSDKTLTSFSSLHASLFPSDDEPLFLNQNPVDRQYPLFRSGSKVRSPHRSTQQQRMLASRAARLGMENTGHGSIAIPVMYDSCRKRPHYWQKCMNELDAIAASKRALPDPLKSKVENLDRESLRQLRVVNDSVGGMSRTGEVNFFDDKTPRKAPRKAVSPELSASKSSPPIKVASLAKVAPPARIVKSTRSASKAKATVDINFKDFEDRAFPSSAQQTKHKRAAPRKGAPMEMDEEWSNIPDFCPPLSSLATASEQLWVEWKHSPLDITKKDYFADLDPREADIATVLRLLPQQYLANKRRMFRAKVEYLKMGKSFIKTVAQGVTHIDVNKTSQLWEAFDRVGWWEDKWFKDSLTTEDGVEE